MENLTFQPAPAPKPKRNALIAAIAAFIIVIGVAAAYVFYPEILQTVSSRSGSEESTAERLSALRFDLDSPGGSGRALEELDALERNALNDAEAGRAQFTRGLAYIAAGQQEAGADLLRAVSLDERYAPVTRAAAIERLVEFSGSSLDREIALSHIFVGDRWSGFLDRGEANRESLSLAGRRALEWAADLSSTALVEFRIAAWYAARIGNLADASEQNRFLVLIKERVARGNVRLAEAVAARQASDPRAPTDAYIASAHLLRGFTLAHLIRHGIGDAPQSAAESNFEAAIAGFGNPFATSFARFHYAAFLASLDAEKYKSKIIELLDPLYAEGVERAALFTYLKNYAADKELLESTVTTMTEDIKRLAAIDDRFSEKLRELGWKL